MKSRAYYALRSLRGSWDRNGSGEVNEHIGPRGLLARRAGTGRTCGIRSAPGRVPAMPAGGQAVRRHRSAAARPGRGHRPCPAHGAARAADCGANRRARAGTTGANTGWPAGAAAAPEDREGRRLGSGRGSIGGAGARALYGAVPRAGAGNGCQLRGARRHRRAGGSGTEGQGLGHRSPFRRPRPAHRWPAFAVGAGCGGSAEQAGAWLATATGRRR